MSDADLLHRLIGCDWGHKIVGDARDHRPCPKDAVQRVALHVDPDDVEGTTGCARRVVTRARRTTRRGRRTTSCRGNHSNPHR